MSETISQKPKSRKPVAKAVTGRLFFLDLSSGRVLSCTPDGAELETLVAVGRKLPDGIVVDPDAGHLYWTNMGIPSANDGSLMRADLDGANRITIVPDGATHTPKQLQLDKKNGKLYWCDREGMRVMRANLDGHGKLETLIDTSQGSPRPGTDATKWCVGIALDVERGQLYWTQKGSDNAGQGRIFRAGLEIPKASRFPKISKTSSFSMLTCPSRLTWTSILPPA